MTKKISKRDLVRELEKIEVLEIITESVDRNDSSSTKLSKLSKFHREANTHIKDERDVILISAKVK